MRWDVKANQQSVRFSCSEFGFKFLLKSKDAASTFGFQSTLLWVSNLSDSCRILTNIMKT